MYKISIVEKTLGIPTFTLRNWEKRYGFPLAQRDETGVRFYSEEQYKLLTLVKDMVDSGVRAKDAIKNALELPTIAADKSKVFNGALTNRLYKCLINFREDDANEVLARLALDLSSSQLLRHVYRPILTRAGEDWRKGLIDVSQEHYVSGYIRTRLHGYLNSEYVVNSKRAPIVLATAPFDFHEGGILLIAAELKLRGIPIIYLGANMPVSHLIKINRRLGYVVNCIGFSMESFYNESHQDYFAIDNPVVVGGPGVSHAKGARNMIVCNQGDIDQVVDFITSSTAA